MNLKMQNIKKNTVKIHGILRQTEKKAVKAIQPTVQEPASVCYISVRKAFLDYNFSCPCKGQCF